MQQEEALLDNHGMLQNGNMMMQEYPEDSFWHLIHTFPLLIFSVWMIQHIIYPLFWQME